MSEPITNEELAQACERILDITTFGQETLRGAAARLREVERVAKELASNRAESWWTEDLAARLRGHGGGA